MEILNTFCANEKHVKKASENLRVPVQTELGKIEMLIPLCNECYIAIKNQVINASSPGPSFSFGTEPPTG